MEDIKNKTSESLASMIVAYRSLGLFKEEAKNSMAELMRRKDSGDNYDFETYISESIKNIPKPEVPNEVHSLLRKISSNGIQGL